jgi:hypothetical protein
MKTLRYNQTTQSFTLHEGQYKDADGKPGRIDPPVVQLEVIETDKPAIDEVTQRLLPVDYTIAVNDEPHNLTGINGTATEVWTVIDKTALEIAREQWHHVTPLRIHAPKALISSQQEMAIMLLFRDIKRVETETGFYLYINEIAPEHAATFAYLQGEGIIIVENYPGG